jgi:xanthine dehydrogenase YagS FAD-binding subunit
VADRNVWDFPLVNLASAIVMSGPTVARCRIAANAVAARPRRLLSAEQVVTGQPRNEETATAAGLAAIEGAEALQHNAYKVPLLRNLVRRAIRETEDGWTS